MKAFHFPLERVLDGRQLQMRAEEEKMATLQHHLELLGRRAKALAAAALQSKLSVMKPASVQGSDLHALTSFQAQVKKEQAALAVETAQCERRVAVQRARLLKAQKDLKVLEKLRERRMGDWTYAYNREVEDAAADAHISKLVRGES